MKHLHLFVALVSLNFITAQEVNTSIQNLVGLDTKTTYYIQSGDPLLDDSVIKYLNQFWTLTKVKSITSDELAQFEGKENESKKTHNLYLSFGKTEFERPYEIPDKIIHDQLQLLLYKDLKCKKKSFAIENLIAEATIDQVSDVQILFGIQLIKSNLQFAYDLKSKSDITFQELLDELSEKNKDLLKTKKLLVLKTYLDSEIDTPEEFKEAFPFAFQFATQKEINQAILDQDDRYAYIKIISYSGMNFVTFFATKDAQILFSFIMRGPNQSEIRKHFFKKALR